MAWSAGLLVGSQAHLSFCVGEAKKSKQAISFQASDTACTALCLHLTNATSARVPLMLAWSVATRGLGTLGTGWAARQDQLPLYRTAGHTDPYRGEGVNGFWRQTGSSSHTIRLRSPLQSSSHPLPDALPHCSLYSHGSSRPLIPWLLSKGCGPRSLAQSKRPRSQGQLLPCRVPRDPLKLYAGPRADHASGSHTCRSLFFKCSSRYTSSG